eukprot:gnl/TRDRNA2_/TRDRNA2_171003_c0_seq1.p1 gnl/TRDRNA2_/TRDRNA2_171003_c0~~gnl/TRDRNA2_/TRDRNA2_171003_c0_seq1.p1  ORF type:complete len:348 (+),score=43.35 gnl/TRDRNA2_/TRDRNA2_171003_c0_seq1:47-1045(+)
MTPETANNNHHMLSGRLSLIKGIAIMLLVILLALLLSSAKVVGLAVKLAIESVDRKFLGVDITVGKAMLGICRGYVNIANLIVHNPDTKEWASKYLIRVDQLLVKVNMLRMIQTMGKEFEIQSVALRGIDVQYDKPAGQDSNVQEVLEFIKHLQEQKQRWQRVLSTTDQTLDATSQASVTEDGQGGKMQVLGWSELGNESNKAEPEQLPIPAGKMQEGDAGSEVIVHSVLISGLGASALFRGHEVRVDIGDMDIPDFQQHVMDRIKSGRQKLLVVDVVSILVRTILKTVLSNGSILSQGVAAAGQALATRTCSRCQRRSPSAGSDGGHSVGQ